MNRFGERRGYGIDGAGACDFERVLTALRHEEPDRVPLMELAVDHPVQSAFLGRPVDSLDDEIAFWYHAGFDYIYRRSSYEFPGTSPAAAIGTRIKQADPADGTTAAAETWDVHGSVRMRTEEDFERYDWPDPDTVDTTNLDTVSARLPDGMALVSGVGGVFTRAWMLMGLEAFCMSLCDEGGLARRILERVADIQCRVLDRVLAKPSVRMIWYGDDLAYTEATIISPGMLRELVLPHIGRLARMTHESGRLFVLHSDGMLLDIMEDLIALGVDAIHPIEPKAMDIVDLKRRYGDRLSLIGNVDLIHTLPHGTPQEIETEVHERIRALAPGGGYAVSSANSIPRYVPAGNFRMMINSALRHGKYPIR